MRTIEEIQKDFDVVAKEIIEARNCKLEMQSFQIVKFIGKEFVVNDLLARSDDEIYEHFKTHFPTLVRDDIKPTDEELVEAMCKYLVNHQGDELQILVDNARKSLEDEDDN